MWATGGRPTTGGVHERDFLSWLRFRQAVAEALGRPDWIPATPEAFENDRQRPIGLSTCGPRCFERLVEPLERQRLVRQQDFPTGRARALADPPHWVAVEAAWRLAPAFDHSWDVVWDLELLDDELGPGATGPADVEQVLLRRVQLGHRSPLHVPRRTEDTRTVQERAARVASGGWIQLQGVKLILARPGRDAATLMRLIVGPRASFPREAFERIGPIRPIEHRNGSRTGPAKASKGSVDASRGAAFLPKG